MSWIAPTMFWLLLLVPAVLLLWFLKIRRTETVVASTILWKRALQDERVRSPFQRLIRNLLLLLQLLAVILAVIAPGETRVRLDAVLFPTESDSARYFGEHEQHRKRWEETLRGSTQQGVADHR